MMHHSWLSFQEILVISLQAGIFLDNALHLAAFAVLYDWK